MQTVYVCVWMKTSDAWMNGFYQSYDLIYDNIVILTSKKNNISQSFI